MKKQKGIKKFFQDIENPPKANKALRELVKDYKFKIGGPGSSISYWMGGQSARLLFVINIWKIYIEVYKKI